MGRENSLKNLRPPWPKGKSGNMKGKKKGTRNAATIYAAVGDKVTPATIINALKKAGIHPTQKQLDDVIAFATAVRAASGNMAALREYNNRRFGQAVQDITLNGSMDHTDLKATDEQIQAAIEKYGLLDGTE
jgi:hypothetical protein